MKQQKILAQIAPQRSSQYASLASTLAESELLLSSIGASIESTRSRMLGNQEFLELELNAALSPSQRSELGSLAMTTSFYELFAEIGDLEGPFLKPLETNFIPSQPRKLISSRRYKGKTNELFTHWLCNIAKFSSKFSEEPWESIKFMDPLAGGGTSLMTALVLGAKQIAGVEQNEKDVQSTVAFFKQFAKEERIPIKVKEERLKKLGKRWTIGLGENAGLRARRLESTGDKSSKDDRNAADRQQLVLAQGDTILAKTLIPSFRPHLIVGDLPYGIHHQGKLVELLDSALPVWSELLLTGGTVALSWDATRFSREKMLACLEKHKGLSILNDELYKTFGHRVDRVIKKRDVIVLRK